MPGDQRVEARDVGPDDLVQSIEILGSAASNLADGCVKGLEATDRGPALVERSLAIVTGLVPTIGYDRAAAIAHEAARTGQSIRQVAENLTDATR